MPMSKCKTMQYSEIFEREQFKARVAVRIALYLMYFIKIGNSISREHTQELSSEMSRSCISNFIS